MRIDIAHAIHSGYGGLIAKDIDLCMLSKLLNNALVDYRDTTTSTKIYGKNLHIRHKLTIEQKAVSPT